MNIIKNIKYSLILFIYNIIRPTGDWLANKYNEQYKK